MVAGLVLEVHVLSRDQAEPDEMRQACGDARVIPSSVAPETGTASRRDGGLGSHLACRSAQAGPELRILPRPAADQHRRQS